MYRLEWWFLLCFEWFLNKHYFCCVCWVLVRMRWRCFSVWVMYGLAPSRRKIWRAFSRCSFGELSLFVVL